MVWTLIFWWEPWELQSKGGKHAFVCACQTGHSSDCVYVCVLQVNMLRMCLESCLSKPVHLQCVWAHLGKEWTACRSKSHSWTPKRRRVREACDTWMCSTGGTLLHRLQQRNAAQSKLVSATCFHLCSFPLSVTLPEIVSFSAPFFSPSLSAGDYHP